MLNAVSNADRERDLRRLERDRRRRERGRPTYFDEVGTSFNVDIREASTEILRPDRFREETTAWAAVEEGTRRESLEEGQLSPAEPTIAPTADIPGRPPRRRLAVSGAIFGLATALSRVLGLVREVVATYYFGASGKINAFTVAFQIPNLFRALVADAALSSLFVPVFTDLLEKDKKRAWRVASTLFWLMLLGLTALTTIFLLVAPWVIGIFGNPG